MVRGSLLGGGREVAADGAAILEEEAPWDLGCEEHLKRNARARERERVIKRVSNGGGMK